MPDKAPHVETDGQGNERKAGIKPVAEKFIFGKNGKCEHDAVNRFQRQREVHGEGGNFSQGADVEIKGENGAYPAQDEEPEPVGRGRHHVLFGKIVLVDGQQKTEPHEATG